MFATHAAVDFRGITFLGFQEAFGSESFESYIAYSLARDNGFMANSLPQALVHMKDRSKLPYLLILDDFHILSPSVAATVIKQIRVPDLRISLLLGSRYMPTADIRRSIETVVLPPLTVEEIHNLIALRLQGVDADPAVGRRFMAEIESAILRFSELSPRFIVNLLGNYILESDFQKALSITRRKYFPDISHLVLTQQDDRLIALPAIQDEPVEILGPTGQSVFAVPYIFVRNVRWHWGNKIEQFEEIMSREKVPEGALQTFFEENPDFLKGVDYRSVLPHPILERKTVGNLIPDFVLQPLTTDYVDIVDLKLPRSKVIVGSDNRGRLSQSVQDSIAQVREYRDYFEDPSHRERFYRRYHLKGYRPNAIVVIGRGPKGIGEEKWRQILDGMPPYLKLVTYDDLIARMKKMAADYSI
jgi:hypothetical protein